MYLHCGESSANKILNNIINFNGENGINLSAGTSNEISNNTFEGNNRYGINSSATKNQIYHNYFIDNNQDGIQARDSRSGNSWNSAEKGNYWSDWISPDEDLDGIVDFPYEIAGSKDAKDYYPLSNPRGMPTPIADAGDDVKINPHEIVFFDSTGCERIEYITNYTWSFVYTDETLSLYGPSPSFIFDYSGKYKVVLNVTNLIGDFTTDRMIVTVRDFISPVAKVGNDVTISQHEQVHLNASNSHDNIGIIKYMWTITNSQWSIHLYGMTPSLLFDEAGEYTVTLNVTDAEGNWDTDTLNVTVLNITLPTADAGPDITINQSETVEFFFHQHSFDNVGIENWTWTFEYNGTEHTLSHSIIMSSLPLFKFDIPGIYTVTMNVTDEAGNWATDTLNITVLDTVLPHADAGSGLEIDAGTIYRFNGTGSGDNVGIVNYTWIFEYDEKTVTLFGPSPEFTFEVPGEYDIDLIVTDADGNSATDWISITVAPIDDDIGPIDNGDERKDKDRRVGVWIWLGFAVFIIVVVVLLLIVWRKKKGRDEVSHEDEMGRIGKDDGTGDVDIS